MKPIRLAPEAYRMGHAFSLTITTANRERLFHGSAAAERCLELLAASVARHDASLFAYCLVPDHVHLLLALPEGTSVIQFVKHFKQTTSYHLQRLAGTGISVWQDSFYDHALRREEALTDVAEYIFNNPVRAGLIQNATDYLYSGSYAWATVLSSGPEGSDLPVRGTPVDNMKTSEM
jgi:putative transposase